MLPDQEKYLKQLYQMYFGKITSFAMATVHDPHIAKEIAQDTFHLAVLHIDKLISHPNPGGWLMQTAKYKIREYQRRRSKELRRFVPLEDIHIHKIEDDATAFEIVEASPSEALLARIQQVLTSEEYLLFQRLILKQDSYLDVAKELDISVSTCYKRFERVRKKLQKYF